MIKPVSHLVKLVFAVGCTIIFSQNTVQAISMSVPGDTTIDIHVNANKVIGHINKNIYGDLLEHIYHSINGGLWGEMLASRSFEPEGSKGWNLSKDDEIVSAGTRISSLFFGEKSWGNYEITGKVLWEPYFVGVPAPWSGGQSDIKFLFRRSSDSVAYAFHLNTSSELPFLLEKITTTHKGERVIVLKTASAASVALITPRKFHRFRIICEGSQITVFIDDQLTISFNDEQAPVLSGSVGLVLTKTSGRFKNLQVKELDGKILWAGLPVEVKPGPVAPDWLPEGNGAFTLIKGQVKNGCYAQKVTVNHNQAGVKQPVFNLRAGEIYRGSVWARGNGLLKLFTFLKDGTKILAGTSPSAVGAGWKKYSFTLKPSSSSAKGDFVIEVKGTGAIWLDQASLMADSSKKTGGYRPDLYKALADLRPTQLRWPGGSYASGYDWKWGIGPQENRVRLQKASWDDFEQNAFGTDEFLRLCTKLNSDPVLVIRIGYSVPDSERPKLIKEAQQWLEYCNGPITSTWGKVRAQNGHPQPYHVKYWEIDNEMWELGVEKYGELLREFVPALKKIDPSIKIIACGDFTEKGKCRDSILFNTSAKYFDYISLHHYESAAGYEDGPTKMVKRYQDEEHWIATSANPNIELYVSEWNASETDWRTGLYAGGILNVFEKDTKIAMAAAALLLRRTDASGWNNAFINFDGNGWFPAPNYVVTKLYREHYQPHLLETNAGIVYNMVATLSADGKTIVVKIVNPLSNAIKVNLHISNFKFLRDAVIYQVAPGTLKSRNTMEYPNTIEPVKINLKHSINGCSYTLPAFSVGLIELND